MKLNSRHKAERSFPLDYTTCCRSESGIHCKEQTEITWKDKVTNRSSNLHQRVKPSSTETTERQRKDRERQRNTEKYKERQRNTDKHKERQRKTKKKTGKGCWPTQLHDGNVLGCVEVEFAQIAFLDVVEEVLVNGKSRTLSFQLKDDHSTIMTFTNHNKHSSLQTQSTAPKPHLQSLGIQENQWLLLPSKTPDDVRTNVKSRPSTHSWMLWKEKDNSFGNRWEKKEHCLQLPSQRDGNYTTCMTNCSDRFWVTNNKQSN